MISPAEATPGMFPLSGEGSGDALFGWPAVVENANVWGYRSVAVPGTVAGLALALERWGTISLAEALAPAIRWAEEGFPVFWHTTLKIAQDLATLKRNPATAAIFLDGDFALIRKGKFVDPLIAALPPVPVLSKDLLAELHDTVGEAEQVLAASAASDGVRVAKISQSAKPR